ncbi:HAMP domain-containing sensor histidine kinase [Croceibacterium ferulae]|uniref:HAMP domain-containing sensor histidine kinase n=1 Tax=Croceibacterium ferulae TaxID=1854641 RepID=UPI000EAC7811|nr:HAMP domain-containing sensor histidine kinase [Croceibacterium ferulae]
MASRIGTTRQITLFFVGCFTVATLALGSTAYGIASRATHRQFDAVIEREAAGLVRVHAAGGTPALQRALDRRDDRGVNTLGYLLFDRAGRRVGGELEAGALAPGWQDILFRDLDGESHAARALTIELPEGLRLTVAAETAATTALERTMVLLFAGGFGVMLVVGLAGGWLFGRAIRRRLETMNATAVAIIGGDLTSRVPLGGHGDEFDQLARTLNRMLDRIDTLVGNVRQVSSDLAHDLRTPITHLRQRLERLLAGVGGDAGQKEEVERAIADADAILSLFAALLRIAEVESGALKRYFRAFDLSACAAGLAESYAPVAEDAGRSLTARISPGLHILGDPELVAQLLVNLLENALRHTPPGSHIDLHLTHGGPTWALLTVADDGPGVAEAHLPRLAERFTRLERSRSAPGHGLGLNLVSAVTAAHGGTLAFKENQPGLAVIVRLPLAVPARQD